jgi:hypothetical protein
LPSSPSGTGEYPGHFHGDPAAGGVATRVPPEQSSGGDDLVLSMEVRDDIGP